MRYVLAVVEFENRSAGRRLDMEEIRSFHVLIINAGRASSLIATISISLIVTFFTCRR